MLFAKWLESCYSEKTSGESSALSFDTWKVCMKVECELVILGAAFKLVTTLSVYGIKSLLCTIHRNCKIYLFIMERKSYLYCPLVPLLMIISSYACCARVCERGNERSLFFCVHHRITTVCSCDIWMYGYISTVKCCTQALHKRFFFSRSLTPLLYMCVHVM